MEIELIKAPSSSDSVDCRPPNAKFLQAHHTHAVTSRDRHALSTVLLLGLREQGEENDEEREKEEEETNFTSFFQLEKPPDSTRKSSGTGHMHFSVFTLYV